MALCPAALKESASTRRGKAEAKELPFVSTFLFSSGEEGVLLTVCLQLRAKRSRASPLPLLSPLQPHCTFKGCDRAVAPHVFKFAFSRYGSR